MEVERDDALQIASVREEEISLLNEIGEAKDKQIAGLQERITELQQERDDALFQKECLVGDIDELRLQLSEATSAAASSLPTPPSSPLPSAAADSEAKALREKLDAAVEQVAQLQAESAGHLKRALQYADDLRAAEAQVAASGSSVAETKALKGRLHHAQVLLDAAEVSKGAAHRRADEADERCAAVMQSVEQLAARVQAAEDAAAQVPMLKAALMELQGDLQAAGEYGAAVKVENDALRAAAVALRGKLQRREKRIAQLKQGSVLQRAAGGGAPPQGAVEEF